MTVFGFAGDISSVNSGASSNSPGSSIVKETIGIFRRSRKVKWILLTSNIQRRGVATIHI